MCLCKLPCGPVQCIVWLAACRASIPRPVKCCVLCLSCIQSCSALYICLSVLVNMRWTGDVSVFGHCVLNMPPIETAHSCSPALQFALFNNNSLFLFLFSILRLLLSRHRLLLFLSSHKCVLPVSIIGVVVGLIGDLVKRLIVTCREDGVDTR